MKRRNKIVISSLLATMFGCMAEAAITDAILDTVNNGANVNDIEKGLQVDINNTGTTTLNWSKLNLAADERLNFMFNANNAVALNQITGKASQIYGMINAEGIGAATSKIILSNPSGILFYNGSVINVNAMELNTMRANGTFSTAAVTVNGLNVKNGDLDIKTTTGTITLDGLKFDNEGTLRATTTSGKIMLSNILNTAGSIEATTGTGTIYVKASSAPVNIGGADVNGITTDYLKLASNGGKVSVEGVVTVGKNFNIETKGNYSDSNVITFKNATVTTKNGTFTIDSTNKGNIYAQNSKITSTENVKLAVSNGTVKITSTDVKADGKAAFIAKDVNLNYDNNVKNMELGTSETLTVYASTIDGGKAESIGTIKADYSTVTDFAAKSINQITAANSTIGLINSTVSNTDMTRGTLRAENTNFKGTMNLGVKNMNTDYDAVSATLTNSVVNDINMESTTLTLADTNIKGTATLTDVTVNATDINGSRESINSVVANGGSINIDTYNINSVKGTDLKSLTIDRSRVTDIEANEVTDISVKHSIITNFGVKEATNVYLKGNNIVADTITLDDINIKGNLTAERMVLNVNNSTVNTSDFIGGSVNVNESQIGTMNAGMSQAGFGNENRWSDNVGVKVSNSTIENFNGEGHTSTFIDTNITGTLNVDCVIVNAQNTSGVKETINNVIIGGGSLTADNYDINTITGISSAVKAVNSTKIDTISMNSVSSVKLTDSTVNNLTSKTLRTLLIEKSIIKNNSLKNVTNLNLKNNNAQRYYQNWDGVKITNLDSINSVVTLNNSKVGDADFTRGSLTSNNSTFTGTLNIGMGSTYDNSDSLTATLNSSVLNNINADGTSTKIYINDTTVNGTVSTIQTQMTATGSVAGSTINNIVQTGGSLKINNFKVNSIHGNTSKDYADGTISLTDSIVDNLKTNKIYKVNITDTQFTNPIEFDSVNEVDVESSTITVADNAYISGYFRLNNSNLTAGKMHINNNLSSTGGSIILRNTTIGHNLILNDTTFDIDASNKVNFDAYITKNLSNSDITGDELGSLAAILKSGHGVYAGFITDNPLAKPGNTPVVDTTYSGNIAAAGLNALDANSRFVEINTAGDVSLNIKNTSKLNINASNIDLSNITDGTKGDLIVNNVISRDALTISTNNISLSKGTSVGTIDSGTNNITLALTEEFVKGESAIDLEGREYTRISTPSNYNVYKNFAAVPEVEQPVTPTQPTTPEVTPSNPTTGTETVITGNGNNNNNNNNNNGNIGNNGQDNGNTADSNDNNKNKDKNKNNTDNNNAGNQTSGISASDTLLAANERTMEVNSGSKDKTPVVNTSSLIIDEITNSDSLSVSKTSTGLIILNDFIPGTI